MLSLSRSQCFVKSILLPLNLTSPFLKVLIVFPMLYLSIHLHIWTYTMIFEDANGTYKTIKSFVLRYPNILGSLGVSYRIIHWSEFQMDFSYKGLKIFMTIPHIIMTLNFRGIHNFWKSFVRGMPTFILWAQEELKAFLCDLCAHVCVYMNACLWVTLDALEAWALEQLSLGLPII